jgi:hypothetical protein
MLSVQLLPLLLLIIIPGQEGESVDNSMKEEGESVEHSFKEEKSVTELQGATNSNVQEENRYEIICYIDNKTLNKLFPFELSQVYKMEKGK